MMQRFAFLSKTSDLLIASTDVLDVLDVLVRLYLLNIGSRDMIYHVSIGFNNPACHS